MLVAFLKWTLQFGPPHRGFLATSYKTTQALYTYIISGLTPQFKDSIHSNSLRLDNYTDSGGIFPPPTHQSVFSFVVVVTVLLRYYIQISSPTKSIQLNLFFF